MRTQKLKKGKIHMASALFKTTTLCGIKIHEETQKVKNPDGLREVTCGNCLRLINAVREE